jgi:hypothetical protein
MKGDEVVEGGKENAYSSLLLIAGDKRVLIF